MRKTFNCKRCLESFKSGNEKPKYCGKCKSSLWNVARTYAITGQTEPTKKRTKLTGKAAARIAREKMRPAKKSAPVVSDRPSPEYYSDKVIRYKVAFYEVGRIRQQYKDELESGEINNRYESGKKRGAELQKIIDLKELELIAAVDSIAEFMNQTERGADAYEWIQKNPQILEVQTNRVHVNESVIPALNHNEFAAFVAAAQEILDCTNGEFGYLSDATLPDGMTVNQFKGFAGSLVKKGFIYVSDDEFKQMTLFKKGIDAIRAAGLFAERQSNFHAIDDPAF